MFSTNRSVRDAGVARRIDVARALVQCASHIGLWRHLVDVRNASVHVSNRWGWRPLHYAAALGAEMLVEELLQPTHLPDFLRRHDSLTSLVTAVNARPRAR